MVQALMQERQKGFDIKKGIHLPKKITRYPAGEFNLFMAPEKATFISTNSFGTEFIEHFQQGKSIEQVIDLMKEKGIEQDKIVSELHTFLVRVERKGFYEDAPVTVVKSDISLHMDITNRCNLSCIQCLQNAGPPGENELSTEEWLNIIDEFRNLNKTRITISGGEPLLYPGIFLILERAKSRGLEVTLFTNGTLISNDSIAETLEKYVDKIQISLDGATKEDNDKIRGKGSFEKIIKAFQLLGKTKITLDMAICLMPQNKDSLRQNVEKMINRIGAGVNIRLSTIMKRGRANKSLMFPDEKIAKSELNMMYKEFYQKKLKSLPIEEKNLRTENCGYGDSAVISSSGDVYPCNIYESRVKLGNVRESSFSEMIAELEILREKVSVENIPLCKACDLKIICNGGCRLNNLYRKNDILTPGCNAEYKKNFIESVIDREENYDPYLLLLKATKSSEKNEKETFK